MTENDKREFAAMLQAIAEMYNRKASPDLMRMYFAALQRYDIEDVRRALNLHVLDPDAGQYFPKPADLVRILGGSKQGRAMLAWTLVDKAIRMVGPYQTVVFDDPIIHAVLDDMGGWVQLCSVGSEDDLGFRANEFRKRFEAYALHGGAPNAPAKLIGLAEAENLRGGGQPPAPQLIGDPEAAMRVLESGRQQLRRMVTDAGHLIERSRAAALIASH